MDCDENAPAASANTDVKPPAPSQSLPPPTTQPTAPAAPATTPARANNSVRTVQPASKTELSTRPAAPLASTPDQREHKLPKDVAKPEEVSEYVHHSVDPSAPIFEITHAITDALILKCADCARFARGTCTT